jgi:hypothetical protein
MERQACLSRNILLFSAGYQGGDIIVIATFGDPRQRIGFPKVKAVATPYKKVYQQANRE